MPTDAIVNVGEALVVKACEEFKNGGIKKCSGVKFNVVDYRHSPPNSELDQLAKIDVVVYLGIYFPNNPFEKEIVQLPLQVKIRPLKKETTSLEPSKRALKKANKRKQKKVREKLHHQYCNPWVPIVVVVLDACGHPLGLKRSLKNIFCQTVARSVRAAIKARKLCDDFI